MNYRLFHGNETALQMVQSDILLKRDDQKITLFVMLDFSIAFYAYDQSIVLSNLVLALVLAK